MGIQKVESVGFIRKNKLNVKQVISFLIAIAVFAGLYFGLPESYDSSPRIMITIVATAIVLWALEPIPIGLTSIIILIAMFLFSVVPNEVVYSGFASPAVFLIIGGMMLARAVNETPFARRVAYFILSKWGRSEKGILGSILVIPQLQAFFIPATAVRASLLIPIATNVIDMVEGKNDSNFRKMILLGVAFGATISGTAVMTAAIGNILAVELLNRFLGVTITYFQWFLYALPIWLILVPLSWGLLLKLFPVDLSKETFSAVQKEMNRELKAFGKLGSDEIKCLVILTVTVGLWMSEPLHGLHPSVSALIGVALMTMPKIGCASWENVVKINFDTVIMVGVTLSIGYALNESGATSLIGESLSANWIMTLLANPFTAVIFILILTQLLHLAISNVSTAVIALVPIYIGLSLEAGADPILISFTAALAALHGYILVVETMPNVLVHSTGRIKQQTFLVPGIYMTIIMILVTAFVAFTWWQIIGFI